MRIQEDITLTDHCITHLATWTPSINLSNRNIEELIEILISKGINVDLSSCEKRVRYRINVDGRTDDRVSIVPIRTVFEGANVLGYILRGHTLEVVLENYSERRYLGLKDTVGGPREYEGGIKGHINFKGDIKEGPRILEVVGIIKNSIESFYHK